VKKLKQNFNEIKQNWNFYMCRVDDKPASIRLNLALSDIAPVEDYNHRISIFIKMNNPTENGPLALFLFRRKPKFGCKKIRRTGL